MAFDVGAYPTSADGETLSDVVNCDFDFCWNINGIFMEDLFILTSRKVFNRPGILLYVNSHLFVIYIKISPVQGDRRIMTENIHVESESTLIYFTA